MGQRPPPLPPSEQELPPDKRHHSKEGYPMNDPIRDRVVEIIERGDSLDAYEDVEP